MASTVNKIIGIGGSIIGTVLVPLIVKKLSKVFSKSNPGKKRFEVSTESQVSGQEEIGDQNETE
ncbi:MAG: hypothetical protein FVQ81_14530 [Candidatus Glassbacteria bacterium]|nr:hypothetical protein [Candidatus Glassbacteria bacterium]